MRRFSVLLIAGDVLALFLFVFIGQSNHELLDPAQPVAGLLLTTGVLALPWMIAGRWLGAFPGAAPSSVRTLMARSLNAWLVAAPLGLLLRAYVLGRAVIPTAFILAALGFGGAILLGWRLAFALIAKAVMARREPAGSRNSISA